MFRQLQCCQFVGFMFLGMLLFSTNAHGQDQNMQLKEFNGSFSRPGASISMGSLDQIDLSMTPALKTPQMKPMPRGTNTSTTNGTQFGYEGAAFRHGYLDFEDPALERYGCSKNLCLQTWISGAKFFGESVLYPLRIARPRLCR